jgi:two-component system, NtrC family, nitrogen regulation response regulator NtrX
MAKILLIDDEASIRAALKEILEYESHEVVSFDNAQAGLDILAEQSFDLIISDIKMPKMDGLEFLAQVKSMEVETPVVMITGHGSVDTAVESLKKGAFDFLQKPLDLNRVLVTVRNATQASQLTVETKQLKKKVAKLSGAQMIGDSAALREISEMIQTVAPTDARVLILGPNGSGKELVARQLHERSQRSAGPFVEVNCAAIPGELIESELFGHEKGAFTSAIKQKPGKFELAENGTLFLDEIGDMSLSAQAKVLRALQENRINRVGGEKDIKVNVRVLAATNKDLKQEIAEGRFREDLYHRLSVIVLKVPSLSARLEDIPLLADYFLSRVCEDYGRAKKKMASEAIKQLQKHHWSGNIREFRNVIERLVILAGETINADDVKKYL